MDAYVQFKWKYNLIRLGFLGWMVFELLNWVKILHFSLDFSWAGLLLTVSWIWGSIEFASWKLRKSGMESLPWAAYLIGLVGTSWDAFGDVAHLYSSVMYYDKYAHFFGGGSAAIVSLFILWRLVQGGKILLDPRMMGFFAICMANFLGILYELEEYSESYFFHNNRMGDAFDTSTDVINNFLGAAVMVVIALIVLRKKKNSESAHLTAV